MIMHMFQRAPLRCRGCGRRFHKRVEEGDLIHRSSRNAVVADEGAAEQPEDANAGQP